MNNPEKTKPILAMIETLSRLCRDLFQAKKYRSESPYDEEWQEANRLQRLEIADTIRTLKGRKK